MIANDVVTAWMIATTLIFIGAIEWYHRSRQRMEEIIGAERFAPWPRELSSIKNRAHRYDATQPDDAAEAIPACAGKSPHGRDPASSCGSIRPSAPTIIERYRRSTGLYPLINKWNLGGHLANQLIARAETIGRRVALEFRMTNLAVKFLSAASAGIVASAPIAMIPLSTVGAAEECLATPKDETPTGKHWYYRIERGTNRHCWYLREEGETSSQAAAPARRAAPEVAPERGTKLARAAADARAELPLPQTLVRADPRIAPTTPARSVDPRSAEQKLSNIASPQTARSPVDSRWPEPTGAFSAGERPISPSFVIASAAQAAESDASADTVLTPEVPPVAPTKAEPSAMGTPAALQLLFLGTFGAIAVSWLAASVIMTRMRRRPKRHISLNSPKWPTAKPTHHRRISPSPEPVTVNSTRRLGPGRAGSQSFDRLWSGLGDDAREIERVLARFANQAQAEP
jgi:hypothetical protein